MPKEFELRLENALPAPPEEVWNAVATGPGNLGWLYTMEIEPWVGGVVSRGPCTVVAWDPPREFACGREDDDGFSMVLRYRIEEGDDRTSTLCTTLHWVHTGVVDDGWDTRTVAATEHAQFFHHILGQYLRYFKARFATFVEVPGPKEAAADDAFTVLRRGLGLDDGVAQGDTVRFAPPGSDLTDAVVDFLDPHFIGVRTEDALYCFFGRNAWGWPVGLSLHLFSGGIEDSVDTEKVEAAWREWLDALFIPPGHSRG